VAGRGEHIPERARRDKSLDNRLWQLFPKQRGASKKPGGGGNDRPHPKHRFFTFRHKKPTVLNLDYFNKFSDKDVLTPEFLLEKKYIRGRGKVKVLGDGKLEKKIQFEGFIYSKTAKDKIIKAGGTIK
jgi:large subunit ribosomal protein L15